MKNVIIFEKFIGMFDGKYECDFICDVIYFEGVRVFVYYEWDYYSGMLVVVENDYGNGKVIYIGIRLE